MGRAAGKPVSLTELRTSMPSTKIFHPAAVAAAVAFWSWQAFWHFAFANQWLDLTHRQHADLIPTDPAFYIVSIVTAFAVAYGTALALDHDDGRTAMHGVQFGIFVGFLFVAGTALTQYLYEGRPLGLWLLNSASVIVGLSIAGAIVGGWKRRPKPSPAAAPPAPVAEA
jgi:hypothetical protein